MGEQLSELMRDEAARIAVPVPPAAAVLTEGRRLRRRRRLAVAASAAAGVAAVAGGALLITGQDRGPDHVGFSVDAYREQGALAVDDELYVAGHHIPFDRSVKSFYYTGRRGRRPVGDVAVDRRRRRRPLHPRHRRREP